MKQILEYIEADWNLLKDKYEREIIESYTEAGRLITLLAVCKKKVLPQSFLIYKILFLRNIIYLHKANVSLHTSCNEHFINRIISYIKGYNKIYLFAILSFI